VQQVAYISQLTTSSSKYSRDAMEGNYYYEAVQVNVLQNGKYTLASDSTMNTYGYIYNDTFDPLNPSKNLIHEDDSSECNGQFKLVIDLQKQMKYILVVTTNNPNVIGSFSILALGPNNVTVQNLSE